MGIVFNFEIIILTIVIIEGITLFGRYVLKIKSRNILKEEMRELHWRHIVHIHHMFIGFIIVILFYYLENWLLVNIGIGIVLSDVLHHFVILRLLENRSEFKIVEEIRTRKKK